MELSRHHLVISNHWHKPKVKVEVHWDPKDAPAGGIELTTSLEDVVEGIVCELEASAGWLTRRSKLRNLVLQSIHEALEKVKETSAYRPSMYVPRVTSE